MIVQDTGPLDAKIMLVGEAPGEAEESSGKPFVGPAGKLLRHMCSHVGIDPASCYITNVMNVRPPGNDFGYFYLDKQRRNPSPALEGGQAALREKIAAIAPKVVVALGAEPLRAICNKRGISDWRGTWLKYRDTNVLPTYHPSYILRMYAEHPIVELDLAKALRCEPKALPRITINPALSDVLYWIGIAEKQEVAAFDIETLGQRIRTIGFATTPTKWMNPAISIPFIRVNSTVPAASSQSIVKIGQAGDQPGSYWSAEDEVRVLDAIARLFDSPVKFYSQNGLSFDAPFIKREFGLEIRNHHLDTMHAFHCQRRGTPIRTLRGVVPIEQVTPGDYVWGWDKGPISVKVRAVAKTQEAARLVRVHYWHRGAPGEGCVRKFIDMTPEHRVRLLSGHWKEARQLLSGDSLTRMKCFKMIDGNEYICQGVKTSRFVFEHFNGPIPEGKLIHHRDGNPTNNMPDNLEALTISDHNIAHGKTPSSALIGEVPWNFGATKLDTVENDVRTMYSAGMSTLEIASVFHVNQSTVSRFMSRKEIATRSLSQAQQLRRTKKVNAKVLYVEALNETDAVYDISVEHDCHCFAANDIIVHNCLYPEFPKGLDFLCSILTDYPNYWTEYSPSDDNSTAYYNGMDCIVTLEAGEKIEKELKETFV